MRMNILAILQAACLAAIFTGAPATAKETEGQRLNIDFISYANPQQVAYDSETILKYLEPRLGIPLREILTNPANE